MKVIKGDLIQYLVQKEFDIVVHGCNCFNAMGSGLAKQLRENWPGVYAVDCETIEGDRNKLGSFTVHRQQHVTITTRPNAPSIVDGHVFYIVNAYTQYTYGRGFIDHFEYNAFETFLYSFKNYVKLMSDSNIRQNERGLFSSSPIIRIGFPKIGSGLAGGDWNRIEGSILVFEKMVKDFATITVVEYEKSK